MGRLRRVIFVLAFCATNALSACVWCDTNPETQQSISALTQLHLEARDVVYRSRLVAGHKTAFKDPRSVFAQRATTDTQEGNVSHASSSGISDLPTFFTKEKEQEGVPTCRFFTDYLEKYFPYADTMIHHLFPTMCAVALKDALLSLVYVMHDTEWRYFVNKEGDMRFELMHVEIFYKQLNQIVGALERASIDWQTNLIVISEPDKPRPAFPILQHWRAGNDDDWAQFFAFYADTIVRLAYLGIRFEDYVQSYTYYERQTFALRFLRGSVYEQTYTQVQRLYNELLKMLRQRLWGGK